MSAREYVQEAVRIVKDLLAKEGKTLKKNHVSTPFPTSYRPELDTTPELGPELASRYSQLLSMLRWAIELSRIDICYEVSVLSQHLALPRQGHLEIVYHVFAYLNKHEKSKIVFDPTTVELANPNVFKKVDWSDIYDVEDIKEELPPRMPEPWGRSVKMSVFVDADHAGNKVTRRLHTEVLKKLQNALTIWYSKRQNTVESSTFGSEFVAMQIAKDMAIALRYKLRMFGIPIDGPADVFCDNQGVVKNTSLPESVLSKKHNAINYHAVREAVAAGIMRVAKEDGETNLADLLTKSLNLPKRKRLLGCMTY